MELLVQVRQLCRGKYPNASLPHVELDYLHWEPNWVEVPNDVMRDRTSALLYS
ncbi:hypothetical protein [Fortiea sp. LEGE XX443]|uniref:hypothetical protein n=1 Tax=Fortiea sp. LEGE XX443 TaxID=1828611 RepID=UPI001D144B32|nr:hypothetical protein [Fortiea sp. LEGE XX443]